MYLLRISFICLLAVVVMIGCASKTAEIAEAPATQEVNLTVGGLKCGKCVDKVQVTLASLRFGRRNSKERRIHFSSSF